MEVELLRKPTLQSGTSYLGRIKNLLARIPTIPTVIVESRQSEEEEVVESLSTITTTTTTTTTEPQSEISTAATSVESLPQLFVVQKLHVSPSMPIDDKIKIVWTRQIKSRLSAILLHSIPKGTCVQEFMMVGKKANALKPTLVITCGDVETKKRVERSFKSQIWLQELLKTNGIMFVTVVANTTLSAGPVLNPVRTLMLNECARVALPSSATTSIGIPLIVMPCESQPIQQCILGGLLMVEGKAYALTAGHPFESHLEKGSLQNSDIEHGIKGPEDEESSEASDEPFVFNGDDDDRGDISSISVASFRTFGDLTPNWTVSPEPLQPSPWKSYLPLGELSGRYNAIIPLPITQYDKSSNELPVHYDWALLRVLPDSMINLPNKITQANSNEEILIERIFSGVPCGNITILGAEKQQGCLHSSPVTMKVDELVLNVQLITLENRLSLGSSGTWVILGEELCGFIVAIREDVPWAYMMPILPVLADIKAKLRTDDVRLPKRGELEALAAVSKASDIEVPNNTNCAEDEYREEDGPRFNPSSNVGRLGRIVASLRKSPLKSWKLHGLKKYQSLPADNGSPRPPSSVDLYDPQRQDIPVRSTDTVTVNKRSPKGLRTRCLTLRSIYTSPYKLWRYIESRLLRIEYRRTRQHRRCCNMLPWAPILTPPRLGWVGEAKNIKTAMALDLKLFWFFVRLLFYAFWNSVFNIIYFVGCFPCFLWIRYRHREFLLDGETLSRQRVETREMLGLETLEQMPRLGDIISMAPTSKFSLGSTLVEEDIMMRPLNLNPEIELMSPLKENDPDVSSWVQIPTQ